MKRLKRAPKDKPTLEQRVEELESVVRDILEAVTPLPSQDPLAERHRAFRERARENERRRGR